MRKINIPEPSKPQTGAFIKRLRRKFFLTQEEICKKIGVSRPTLNKIENDKAEITLMQAKKLADFFNVALSDLLAHGDTANSNIRSSLIGPDSKSPSPIDADLALIRLEQLVLYIWHRLLGEVDFNDLEMHSLLFLIESQSISIYNNVLIGFPFIKKNNSPILLKLNKATTSLIEKNQLEKVVSQKYEFPELKYLPLQKYNFKDFSANELLIIDQVITSRLHGGKLWVLESLSKVEQLLKCPEEKEVPLYPQ